MEGTQPLPGASNTVIIDISYEPPEAAPVPENVPGLLFDVEMFPPSLPNPKYARCVRVLENPYAPNNPAPTKDDGPFLLFGAGNGMAAQLEGLEGLDYLATQQAAFSYENGARVKRGVVPGAVVCALEVQPPEKSLWDHVVAAVKKAIEVWDLYASMYDMLKAKLAEGLVLATGCENLASEETCAKLSSTAVEVGFAAVGAPPSIPRFEEVADAAKGEAVEVIIAKSGVCEGNFQQDCEKLAGEMLGGLIDEMQVVASKAAVDNATSSQHILALNPDIVVIPEPAGTVAPAVYLVTITRGQGDFPAGFSGTCKLSGSVWGEKDHWEWTSYGDGSSQSRPVVGEAMVPRQVEVDVSDLAPGESKQAPLVLSDLAKWYLPGQHPSEFDIGAYKTYPHSWIFFNEGGRIDMVLQSNCGTHVWSQGFPQDATFTEPWEIPYP